MKIVELINTASAHLNEKGFENARLEVEKLLGSILGLSRVQLYMEFDRPLSEEELERFRTAYKRRLSNEPLQYILGKTGFMDVELKTDRRALIPRPETETLVEIAIDFLKNRGEQCFADLGTGTGAVALSVLWEIPTAKAVAVDICEDAIMLAMQNARALGLEDRISFVIADMTAGLEGKSPLDAILSNPPYIASGDMGKLQPEIKFHEPGKALDGGPDGMKYLHNIGENACKHLKSGGLLAMECGYGQAVRLKNELDLMDMYSNVEIIRDLAGKDRIIKAIKR